MISLENSSKYLQKSEHQLYTISSRNKRGENISNSFYEASITLTPDTVSATKENYRPTSLL